MGRHSTFPPTIHVHKRGYSYCRVYSGGRPRDVRLGPPGSPEANVAYAKLCAELAGGAADARQKRGVPEAPRHSILPLTVEELCVSWDDHAERHYGTAGSELRHFRAALRPLCRLFGDLPAADFDAGRLEQVQAAMGSGSWMNPEEVQQALRDGKPPGWCRNQVNRQVVRIRTCWRWAERQRLVPPGSWGSLRTLPGLSGASKAARQTPRRRPCTAEDLDAVCARCAPAVAAMLRVQWATAMRSGEVRTMRASEIDRAGDVWAYRPAKDKNAWREGQPERLVHLGPDCQALLGPWLAAAAPPPGDYLFRPAGRRVHPCYSCEVYARHVARACAKAGVKLVPYQTRHAARLRITRAEGLDAARAVLGHKSLSTTIDYAAGIDQETAREAARKLG